MKANMTNFWDASRELYQSGNAFVVATLVHIRGHAPQEMGAKILVTAAGLYFGTVGGGKVEAQAIEHSLAILKKKPERQPPQMLTWNLQRDVGMTCGGEVTFLFETHQCAGGWNVVVFGAGHVGQALVRTLENLDCKVVCVDTRPEWIEKLPISPKIKTVCVADLREYVYEADPQSYFTVMTKGHATDCEVLEAIFKKFPDARYVGCIGSDVKTIKLRSELKAKGVDEALVKSLHCPIGLELGTNDPYEVAISISAQLLQKRDQFQSDAPQIFHK